MLKFDIKDTPSNHIKMIALSNFNVGISLMKGVKSLKLLITFIKTRDHFMIHIGCYNMFHDIIWCFYMSLLYIMIYYAFNLDKIYYIVLNHVHIRLQLRLGQLEPGSFNLVS